MAGERPIVSAGDPYASPGRHQDASGGSSPTHFGASKHMAGHAVGLGHHKSRRHAKKIAHKKGKH